MADNKKYYYIKLKDNYFEQDNIKVLESMKNGHTYSLIIIKLYLKSAKTNGRLMMTSSIPYDPQKVDILANVINHDVAHVKEAIRLGVELDLITILDGHEIWMSDIQNFIGTSSTEADRIRSYRKKINTSVQMYNKCTPELEKEIKRDIEIEKDIELNRKQEVKKLVSHSIPTSTTKDIKSINHTDSLETRKSGKQNGVQQKEKGFDRFWSMYPKKKSKGQAEKAWKKINLELYDTIFTALERYKQSKDWTKADGRYIPYPATWLNAKGWEDDIDVTADKATGIRELV